MQCSHEVLRDAFEKCGPKEIAAALGVSLSTVYKWSQPEGEDLSGTRNPLDRARLLMELTDHLPIIQWLCHKAGGFFVWDPAHGKSCRDLLPATNEIIQEFADMLAVIARAASDNRISDGESRTVRQSWEELKTVMESFVVACEEGHFSELRRAVELHQLGEPPVCECRPETRRGAPSANLAHRQNRQSAQQG
jgi:hypothetical protein